MTKLLVLLNLYAPLLVAFVAAVLMFRVRENESRKGTLTVRIPLLLSEFSFDVPVSVRLWRAIFGLVAACAICLPSVRDYSQFFPSKLRMNVCFDQHGIERALAQFSNDEIAELRLSPEWEIGRIKYYTELDAYLEANGFSRFRFDKGELLTSTGWTTFVVEKEDFGLQRYTIVASEGELRHEAFTPGEDSSVLTSKFKLLDSPDNVISIEILDVYRMSPQVLRPRFRQMFVTENGDLYNHSIVAVTKISFFPYPTFGNSVYLVETESGFVPVGYATYHGE